MDQIRTTASAIYAHRSGTESYWSGALVWGMNTLIGDRSQQSVLAEGAVSFGAQAVFGRIEAVEKSAEELELGTDPHRLFSIFALSLGTSRKFFSSEWLEFALGVQGTVYATASDLEAAYGKNPVGAEVFLRVSPALLEK